MKHLSKKESQDIKTNQKIYLSVDHLKKGDYTLNLLLDDKVLKSIEFKKN